MAEETKENGQSSGSSEWQGAVDFEASWALKTVYAPGAINQRTTAVELAGNATSNAIVAQTLTARTPGQVSSQSINRFRPNPTGVR